MSVWWRVLVMGLLVACKRDPARGPALVTRVPHVDKVDVVANEASSSLPPPLVVVVDAAGTISVDGGPRTWKALATYAPVLAMQAVSVQALENFVSETSAFNKRARDQLSTLASFERPPEDDPPPPEEPDDDPPPPEEPEDTLELDETAPRKMHPPPPRPKTTRGRHSDMSGGFQFGSAGPGPPGNPVGGPGVFQRPPEEAHRMIAVTGEPVAEVLTTQAVVAADPTAKASSLVDAVQATEGAILVETGGALRVLRVQFAYDRESFERSDPRAFIEVRASAAGLEVEAVPSPPTKLAWDFTALVTTVRPMFAMKRFGAASIDVLVDYDLTAQQLVDLIVALDRGGMKSIGIGTLLPRTDKEWELRGRWRRMFKFGPIDGGAAVRDPVKRAEPALRACYEAALEKQPDIEGAAEIAFLVDPKGKPAKLVVDGIDPRVGDCFVRAIQGLEFAKPTTKEPLEARVKIYLRPYIR